MSDETGNAGTLILSVGGSQAPLRLTIESRPWARVVFVVSDGSGGSPSSRTQVDNAEINYGTSERPEPGPGLRHLPACPEDIGIVAVPPDDLDRALALVDAALSAELARGAPVTVNYTGGTKTMTAALVLAGTAHEGVRLEFVAGERRDLSQVRAGSERMTAMPGHLLGVASLFALARAETGRRAYGAARAVVAQIGERFAQQQGSGVKPPKSWRQRCDVWERWLSVLDAWDRFDFAAAGKTVAEGLRQEAPWAQAFEAQGSAPRLRALAEEARSGPGPALCEDLWLNAQRRADLGLYDDAIARLYRLAEAAVQARLNCRHGIRDTGAVPRGTVPAEIAAGCHMRTDHETGQDVVALPLFRALSLLAHLDPGDTLVKAWPQDERGFKTPDWQTARNNSILAHGFRPAGKQDWAKARAWFDVRRHALWEELLGRPTAAQLPDTLS
ncbi:TIGR02710 family CRISPR-associated CARF protein [Tabrizicola sp. YIM 78059]|uniref:TIGR02710 family CRISPR-associated CARF protein n=1 Tax=Tabrizicola sp. YIM 78059 TaxID=2529861 RepID=UPI0010AB2C25|nr:TIGR02710 family CRISPR-associated CARF protein [Tabrizicola sp. YIM 78059]